MTVQAAISAASMLAMAKAQARNHPLPQNILMQAPVNMRSQASCHTTPTPPPLSLPIALQTLGPIIQALSIVVSTPMI